MTLGRESDIIRSSIEYLHSIIICQGFNLPMHVNVREWNGLFSVYINTLPNKILVQMQLSENISVTTKKFYGAGVGTQNRPLSMS